MILIRILIVGLASHLLILGLGQPVFGIELKDIPAQVSKLAKLSDALEQAELALKIVDALRALPDASLKTDFQDVEAILTDLISWNFPSIARLLAIRHLNSDDGFTLRQHLSPSFKRRVLAYALIEPKSDAIDLVATFIKEGNVELEPSFINMLEDKAIKDEHLDQLVAAIAKLDDHQTPTLDALMSTTKDAYVQSRIIDVWLKKARSHETRTPKDEAALSWIGKIMIQRTRTMSQDSTNILTIKQDRAKKMIQDLKAAQEKDCPFIEKAAITITSIDARLAKDYVLTALHHAARAARHPWNYEGSLDKLATSLTHLVAHHVASKCAQELLPEEDIPEPKPSFMRVWTNLK